jgi:peroxiredoxin
MNKSELKAGDKAPAFTLQNKDGKVLQTWYKVKPEQTVPLAVEFVKGLER